MFSREIRVTVHHEDAPRWCTHPWSHVQILHVGHHLCARLFIPDRAVRVVDGWPSPSLLYSHYILLLLRRYLFFLLFLLLLLRLHVSLFHLWVCAVPFPFRGRCALNGYSFSPPLPHRQRPELCRYYTRIEIPRGKSIRAASALCHGEICALSLLQLRELNRRASASCTPMRIFVFSGKLANYHGQNIILFIEAFF